VGKAAVIGDFRPPGPVRGLVGWRACIVHKGALTVSPNGGTIRLQDGESAMR
jgi:hypothetical protein